MKIENKERLYLLSLVKADLRKAENQTETGYSWDSGVRKKNPPKYGLAKLTTMYTCRELLTK